MWTKLAASASRSSRLQCRKVGGNGVSRSAASSSRDSRSAMSRKNTCAPCCAKASTSAAPM
ncbi:hypothetical protein, partial [Herbaspirillum lusitanum]|uniref:hypothetical protein n=1 Tax=Herbaspirillum lusitanum TaxID=213312 RepID=UPI001EE68E41